MLPMKDTERKRPSSNLEIGLPKDDYFGESKLIWEQSDHVDLTEKARLHATGSAGCAWETQY